MDYMPRYFFRILGVADLFDDEGETLVDDDHAARATLEILAQTLPGQATALLSGIPYSVEATDDQGGMVCRLAVSGRRRLPTN